MKRIMVIGVSAGVGKSTFARRLGELLQLKVYHLDAYFWKPNWVEASLEEFVSAQQIILQKKKWIVEGSYNNTFELRVKSADTIIYLELPLRVCLYRVIKRWLTNLGKTRMDMGKGCKEKLDWRFLKFIITTYFSRKKKMKARLKAIQEKDLQKQIILLQTKKDIEAYLVKLEGSLV
ncbi:MAG: topology modulation protein [Bacillus sp. (in: firmicutes)]